MIATELIELITSSEFKHGLEEISSYLASIIQERPIVYLLAKCLWKGGYKFELEDQRQDLFIDEKRVEFKFNYDRCEKFLADELKKHGDNLTGMWELIQANAISRSRGVLPKIYEDACVRKPHIFVWIICSRDLAKVADEDLTRICLGGEQCKYNAKQPYRSGGDSLPVVDLCLEKLQTIRPFSLFKQDIETNGDFPSTYHFRICEFDVQKQG